MVALISGTSRGNTASASARFNPATAFNLRRLLPRRITSFTVIHALNLGTLVAKRKDWRARVKGLLKDELKRRNLSYADLAGKLAAVGITDSERNISNKISRGTFTAVF